MEAGKLNRTIFIYREVETSTDDLNTPIKKNVCLAKLKAQVIPVSSREIVASGLTGREINYRLLKFSTHYKDFIQFTDKIFYEEMFFDIISKNELGFKEGLEILAEAKFVRS